MKLRFSSDYVDEKNVLTDKGRKLRDLYLSKKDLTASFFSMAQPILCVGIEEGKVPQPLLPLIKELKDKGIVVEVAEVARKKEPELDDALIQAKTRQIEDGLRKDHDIRSSMQEEVIKGELDSTLDIAALKDSKRILKTLHAASKTIGARVVLIKKVGDGFKAVDCMAAEANAVKIRLSTLVRRAAQVYSSFSETDAHIRSDKSAKEPDVLCEAISISKSKRAKLYMMANFKRSHEPYMIAITTQPDAGDGMVILDGRRCLEKLDALL